MSDPNDQPKESKGTRCMGSIRGGIDSVGNKIESFMPMNSVTSIGSKLFRKQNIAELIASRERENVSLPKILNAFDLTALGIGCIIGAGIFVITGVAAQEKAGPSLMLSFLFAGIACIFSALCYAEFAARVPIAGSAYTYAYSTTGEFIAWVIGWNLILEYTIGAATVARGWSGYLVQLLNGFGISYPAILHDITLEVFTNEKDPYFTLHLDVTAACAIFVVTCILAIGVRESNLFNKIVVIITLAIILFIIGAGFYLGSFSNWVPFFPYSIAGVFRGSSTIFFAYIGFDAVATAAEEAKNPKRDIPIGILGSLSISTCFYVLITGVLTMMVPYLQINLNSPLASAFAMYGWNWASIIIAMGAFAALTTSILGNLLAQPRIFFAMSKDGLIPEWFGKIHPKFKTPLNSTFAIGFASAFLAFILDIETLSEMVSIGTLLAFTIVCCGILYIRYSSPSRPYQSTFFTLVFMLLVFLASFSYSLGFYWPIPVIFVILSLIPGSFLFLLETYDRSKSFSTPLVPLVPMLGIACNIFLIANLGYATWIRLIVWLSLGLLIYFFYGMKNSKLSSTYVVTSEPVNEPTEIEMSTISTESEKV